MVGLAASPAASPPGGAFAGDWLVVAIVYGWVVVGVILFSVFRWRHRGRECRRLLHPDLGTLVSRDDDPGLRRFADAVARGDFDEAERTARWVFFMRESHTDRSPGNQSRRSNP
jgi:hypothetical protein